MSDDKKEQRKYGFNYKVAFDEYHKMFRDELKSQQELSVKISNLHDILVVWHSLVKGRYAAEYNKLVQEILSNLEKNPNYSLYTNNSARTNRKNLLVKWGSLIVERDPVLSLEKNLNKVDFGD